jgi:hypothetical protein
MNLTQRPQSTGCVSSPPARGPVSGRSGAAASRLRRRLSAIVLIAVAAVALPHSAWALMPLPPPPVRFPILDIGRTILTVAEDYAEAPLTQKRQLHNELVLTLNTTRAAL